MSHVSVKSRSVHIHIKFFKIENSFGIRQPHRMIQLQNSHHPDDDDALPTAFDIKWHRQNQTLTYKT